MNTEEPHRRTIRHMNDPCDAHELTFSCFRRQPLFDSDQSKACFIQALGMARSQDGFHLWGYVIMPEHVHLLVWYPFDPYSVESTLKTLKQSAARKATSFLRRHRPDELRRLATGRSRPPYHFWQDGPGYDRNLINARAVHASLEYIHNNPLKRGLVNNAGEWPWSSFRAWLGEVDVPLGIDAISFPVI